MKVDNEQHKAGEEMRILIADDQAKVRSALRLWLGRQAGIQVLGEAVDARGVIDWVSTVCADVVLLDWELPGRDDLDLLSELRKRCPGMAIVALSGRAEARAEARAGGADAFVSKCEPPAALWLALESVGYHGFGHEAFPAAGCQGQQPASKVNTRDDQRALRSASTLLVDEI